MRMVMQRVSFSPESGGVWKPKITCKVTLVSDIILFYTPVGPDHAGDEDAGADQVVEVVDGAAPHADLAEEGVHQAGG